MCAKSRPPAVRSVRTPEALAALGEWLDTLAPTSRSRGRIYQEEGRVLSVRADADHFVEAEVEGQADAYLVTLFLTRGRWSSSCSCPLGGNCKHVVAASLMWIANEGADYEVPEPPRDKASPSPAKDVIPPPLPAVVPPAGSPVRNHLSFRKQWTPVLAEKLGRPLTDAEGRQLGQLSALFTDFAQSHHTLYDTMLRRHGFADAIPADAVAWTPLFSGWWNRDNAPADPWELWQFLAYSLEIKRLPVPELFGPLTDTSRVRAVRATVVARQQLQTWQQALTVSAEPAPAAEEGWRAAAGNLRARLDREGRLFIEQRAAPDKPWKPPQQKWTVALDGARPADFASLPPAESALLLTLRLTNRHGFRAGNLKHALDPEVAEAVLTTRAAHPVIVLPNGDPFVIEPEPLVPEAVVSATDPDQLEVKLAAPDGSSAAGARLIAGRPALLYLHAGRVWRGPPPLPATPLPTLALGDTRLMTRLRATGLRLPAALALKFRCVPLRPLLRLALAEPENDFSTPQFHAQLFARADEPRCEQQWRGQGGWQWSKAAAPPPRGPDDPIIEFNLDDANAVAARFADFRLTWNEWTGIWTRPATKTFPEDFLAWHATLPPGLDIETAPELAGFFVAPLRATMDFSAQPAAEGHDWFDLTVALRVEDTTLSAEEVALLLKARGKWVRLPKGGWRRLELAGAALDEKATAALDRLGLTAGDVLASGKSATHRLHALQLAGEAAAFESRDSRLAAALRQRAADLTALPQPPLPAGLTATLRPYQAEGFQFLAHLSARNFGGVLADDMGLGKTVQALAWLLHLAAAAGAARKDFRVLVVCPKSVTHGWLSETARFAPSLTAAAFIPAPGGDQPATPVTQLLVANYTQLRLNAAWFQTVAWDAVILDEAQFIKNPSSQMAVAARALNARHRLILTGTPIENRLTDLWSLFAFAQPGLLGAQAAFRRQYDDKDPAALARLHRRVRHFLLRRTKAQAAPDLPPRTEDEIVVELEPGQRKLYDAELKRARAQLLGIQTSRALDRVRFNILASLLRLRQICCHPALVDAAHADLPSAKLEALLERLEELQEEGHQVLVFSQFVGMLEIIRPRLAAAGIGHLMLTGATEDRAALVDEFQRDRTKTVFLLSLKAAGFGLNLTAASYAILYDPWWNPAVEAQAIDRTHRIGQTRPVIAYRLLAADTVEQKIRALQSEKAALAAAVVQEESLATVMDLESLRRILI
ncbi:MAG: DEAD/DEAH box helicase [Opitutaceae bacterium]|nr:DEAD/DEAH box helicase [Opitutaceae bacterium]